MDITPEGIARRIDRLAAITLELMGDQNSYRTDASLPLLYVERRELVGAMAQAVEGIEVARVTLARARGRMEAD